MEKTSEIIDRYKLDKLNWYTKGAHSILHTIFPASINLLKPLKEYYGDSMKIFIDYIDQEVVYYTYCEEDMVRLRESIIQKVMECGEYLEEYISEWNRRVKLLEKIYKKIDQTILGNLSNQELISLYRELYDAYVFEYALAMAIPESFSLHSDKFIEPYFEEIAKRKGIERKFREYYAALMAPVTSSFVEEEKKDLLRIILECGSSLSALETLLNEHQKKYFWIRNNYAVQKILGVDFFKQELEELVKEGVDAKEELEKMEKRFVEMRNRKEKIIDELGLKEDRKMMVLIKMVERFAALQDERKKNVLICNHYQRLFMNEIGKRFGLSEDELDYTIFPEIEQLFNGQNIDKERLRKRKEHCLVIFTEEDYEIFEGELSKEICERVFKKNLDGIKELKGTVASTGIAVGKAMIVKTIYDLGKVKEGDILVANMTRPEMVVAMKKASAIVTDEGGITSHAAVVSRELGIPCIVGTKYATKIFKDGDQIEVDANKGIVSKK